MTNALIEKCNPGETVWDRGSRDSIKGLHVRALGARKVYYLFYRLPNGSQRRPKLGDHGILTLTQARDAARGMLLQVALGKDPSVERRVAPEEMTVNDLFSRCFTEHWDQERYRKSGWSYEAKRLFEKDLKSVFGTRAVETLTLPEIESWHQGYREKPRTGNCALNIFKKLFSFAEQKQWRPQNTNLCALVEPHPESKRERYASRSEIQKIGTLLEREQKKSPAAVAFLYLLMFTGSRPRAIERATWDQLSVVEVKGENFGILKFDGKTGRESVVLPPQAMRVIAELPRMEGCTITGIKMPRKLWVKIRNEAGCPDLWARDWRRTFATIGMSGGTEMSMISEVLNHKSTQTTKIYAKLQEDVKIEVAANIASEMERLMG